MPAELMIACENLTKRFGSFTAGDHGTLSVAKGSIFGFLGPNGSGTSEGIRMLCGILEPTEGTARVGGIDVVQETEQLKGRSEERRVGKESRSRWSPYHS